MQDHKYNEYMMEAHKGNSIAVALSVIGCVGFVLVNLIFMVI